MKKKVIILFVVGLIMLTSGLLYHFVFSTKSKENKDIEKKELNSFEKEHCLKNICMRSMKIKNTENYSIVTVKIRYISSSDKLSSDYIKVCFELNNDKTIIHPYYYKSLDTEKEQTISLYVVYKDVIDAIDYTIEEPTEDEIQRYNKYGVANNDSINN